MNSLMQSVLKTIGLYCCPYRKVHPCADQPGFLVQGKCESFISQPWAVKMDLVSRAVRPLGVVVDRPLLDHDLRLLQLIRMMVSPSFNRKFMPRWRFTPIAEHISI